MAFSHFILLLTVVAVHGKSCGKNTDGFCAPLPPPGTACPFNAKECVQGTISMASQYDPEIYYSSCEGDDGQRLEQWVQTTNGSLHYANNVRCVSVNATGDLPDKDGKWRAFAYDSIEKTEKMIYEDVERIVCAKYTGCPQCGQLPYASQAECMEDNNCEEPEYNNTKFDWLMDSLCVAQCSGSMYIAKTDGSHDAVAAVYCDPYSHQWVGLVERIGWPQKFWSKMHCTK